MNKTSKLVGTGIAVIVGSALAVAPAAGASVNDNPARICVDNSSAGQCESVIPQAAPSGGGGREVVLYPTTVGRPDVKDHPNYGQTTPEIVVRIDAKDHPNYGQVTPQSPGRGDAKDHPDYGPSSAPGGGGGVIIHSLRALRAS